MSLEAFKSMAYGPIGEAVIAAEPHTEADPVGIYAGILALWSASINGYVILPKDKPVAVWTVLAGESALGRKGTALRVARGMLNPAIGAFLDARTAGGLSSGPSLTQLLHEKQEETEGTEDGVDTRLIPIDEEWSENLKRQNRCPTYSAKLRSCWDGSTIRHITTKDHMVVEKPHLGFHAHITPAEWSEYIKPRDAKGGSYNRLLPVLVEGSKVLPYDHQEVYPEIKGLSEAYDWARRSERVMSLNREAGARFDELRVLFLDKMQDMPRHLTCYVERTPEQIMRVAAVLAASEMKTIITRKMIDAAWAFVQYSMRSVEKLVREDTKPAGGRVAKTLPELIREIMVRYEGEVAHSLMLRCLGIRATAASLRKALEGMEDIRIIRGVTSGKGRPGVVYRWANEGEEEPTPEASKPVIPEQKTEPVPSKEPELALSGGWL
ncbi:DUF3987 domain-containing protein [Streptomyces sp. NPDC058369]|uniref:DUF3987 domain-containing protein n=1 Tax=Streptomyces sp. NPDC058369 TaxID=3346462 RepID=UPI00365D0E42